MVKQIHHLNCGTMCPYCEKLINNQGGYLTKGKLVCHCLLIETSDDLILVDTGYGTQDIAHPQERLGNLSKFFIKPILSLEETAIYQIQKLGYTHRDVTRIIPTHLDHDHIGGLSDFPKAKIHVLQSELQQLISPTLYDRLRFHKSQISHHPLWEIHHSFNKQWFGINALQPIHNCRDILMISLPGHTKGHVGIAVKLDNKWLLHCGDAYYHHSQITLKGKMPQGLKVFNHLARSIPDAHQSSLKCLQHLYQQYQKEIDFFCAHDPLEFEYFNKK